MQIPLAPYPGSSETSVEANARVVSTAAGTRVILSEPSGLAHCRPVRLGVTEEALITFGAHAASSPATGVEVGLAGRKGRG